MANFSRAKGAMALLLGLALPGMGGAEEAGGLSQDPMSVVQSTPPMTMLVMGRNHKLYYEAYNDASDLDGDDIIDVGYQPGNIDYLGYFDSFKCYTYSESAGSDGRWQPAGATDDPGDGDKTCSGSEEWSGDYLNYVTTTRMDALREVLFGGYRSTDTLEETVLERVFIPQDAHTWAKSYTSVEKNGYAISDYSSLDQPVPGRRHLIANTSLGYGEPPLMRVLNDTRFRKWNWVSKERPVAGSNCAEPGVPDSSTSCEESGSGFTTLQADFFNNLTRRKWDKDTNEQNMFGGHPGNANQWDTLENQVTSREADDTADISAINATNPFGGEDNYVTIIEGELEVPATGNYTFKVRSDDSADFLIRENAADDYEVVASCYDGHGAGECDNRDDATGSPSFPLQAGESYDIKYRHEEEAGGSVQQLQVQDSADSNITDYTVRVEVCNDGLSDDLRQANCFGYTDGAETTYKPTGLLHEFGQDGDMLFGLLTGSYGNNLEGGVLRRNIQSFGREINKNTGIFKDKSTVNGIYHTISSLRIGTFNWPGEGNYVYDCKWDYGGQPLPNGKCMDWGNPIGEMLYESTRYFAREGSPTSVFSDGADGDLGSGNSRRSGLDLPEPGWDDPYADGSAAASDGAGSCSRPFNLVISDINPSYDADNTPLGGSGDLTAINDGQGIDTLLQTMTDEEGIAGNEFFVGESGANEGEGGAPTAKTVNDLGEVRGTAEEPTKGGSYSSAGIAYYGNRYGVSTGDDTTQPLQTFSVALASPLPRFDIPIDEDGDQVVTIFPFAKSVGGSFGIDNEDGLQPTNQIVDFYVDKIRNVAGFPNDDDVNDGRPFYRFRVNFEDVEKGADHDMDAIIIYELSVTEDDELEVDLTSEYAAGGIIHHLGYVIAGVENEGPYLEVRDADTGAGSDPDYFLDTPDGSLPSDDAWDDDEALPLNATRTFTPSSDSGGVEALESPLWLAGKWGSFVEEEGDGHPEDGIPQGEEWDANDDGVPDGFGLVTNPARMEERLRTTFERIVERSSLTGSLESNSATLGTDTRIYSASFDSEDWSGDIKAFEIVESEDGFTTQETWSAQEELTGDNWEDRKLITADTGEADTQAGVAFRWPSLTNQPASGDCDRSAELDDSDLSQRQLQALSTPAGVEPGESADCDNKGQERLEYIRGRQDLNDGLDEDQYRDRGSKRLGDIVRSSPVFVGNNPLNYPDNWGDEAPENDVPYSTAFADDIAGLGSGPEGAGDREGLVYVGANDGILHAFDADSGRERFGYVPRGVYDDLPDLTATNYGNDGMPHRAFVDGRLLRRDVFFDEDDAPNNGVGTGQWRSVLTGGLGPGGKGVYTLDVTSTPAATADESDLAEEKVLWDFTGAKKTAGNNDNNAEYLLGHVYNPPAVVRLRDGNWVAIVGNGFQEDTGEEPTNDDGNTKDEPAMLVIKIETGEILAQVKVGNDGGNDPEAEGNGLGPVLPVDLNGDSIADYAYAGDFQGNMYRFDLTSDNQTAQNISSTKIFEATDDDGEFENEESIDQKITSRPSVGAHPSGLSQGVVVYFGTGKYVDSSDKSSDARQSFYAVWDRAAVLGSGNGGANSSTFPINRDDLYEQEIINQGDLDEAESDVNFETENRITTAPGDDLASGGTKPPFTWFFDNSGGNTPGESNGFKGWYLDLIPPGNDSARGERVVQRPVLDRNIVRFSTVIPSDSSASEACTVEGDEAWFMALNRANGARPNRTPFDNNGDGKQDASDFAKAPDTVNNLSESQAVTSSGRKQEAGGVAPVGGISLANKPDEDEDGLDRGSIVDCRMGSDSPECTEKELQGWGRQSWQQLQ